MNQPPPHLSPPVVRPPHAGPDGLHGSHNSGSVRPPSASSTPTDKHSVLHSRGLILGLLFGVLAVLGLPLLWYSSAFTRSEKLFWSLIVCVYTLVLLLLAGLGIWLLMRALHQHPFAV